MARTADVLSIIQALDKPLDYKENSSGGYRPLLHSMVNGTRRTLIWTKNFHPKNGDTVQNTGKNSGY
jgi:hypothetical protein